MTRCLPPGDYLRARASAAEYVRAMVARRWAEHDDHQGIRYRFRDDLEASASHVCDAPPGESVRRVEALARDEAIAAVEHAAQALAIRRLQIETPEVVAVYRAIDLAWKPPPTDVGWSVAVIEARAWMLERDLDAVVRRYAHTVTAHADCNYVGDLIRAARVTLKNARGERRASSGTLRRILLAAAPLWWTSPVTSWEGAVRVGHCPPPP